MTAAKARKRSNYECLPSSAHPDLQLPPQPRAPSATPRLSLPAIHWLTTFTRIGRTGQKLLLPRHQPAERVRTVQFQLARSALAPGGQPIATRARVAGCVRPVAALEAPPVPTELLAQFSNGLSIYTPWMFRSCVAALPTTILLCPSGNILHTPFYLLLHFNL